ncbi:MAG: hypothetical protein E7Z65_07755 [Thermoplasmata archaeon]|nr:hypothetical protein [Thermoplasmata archaeon]
MNTKGIKFLAVLAVLAMAFAVFAVLSDSQNNDADDPVKGDFGLTDSSVFGLTNANLGNELAIEKVGGVWTITGTVNKVSETNQGATIANAFEATWPGHATKDYGYGIEYVVYFTGEATTNYITWINSNDGSIQSKKIADIKDTDNGVYFLNYVNADTAQFTKEFAIGAEITTKTAWNAAEKYKLKWDLTLADMKIISKDDISENTLTLTKDSYLKETIALTASTTIELKGYSLVTKKTIDAFHVDTDDVKVTINANGGKIYAGDSVVWTKAGTKGHELEVNGGTYYGGYTFCMYQSGAGKNTGSCKIVDATIYAKTAGIWFGNGGTKDVTITNVNVDSLKTGIYLGSVNTATLTNVNVVTENESALEIKSGTVTVNGGSFTTSVYQEVDNTKEAGTSGSGYGISAILINNQYEGSGKAVDVALKDVKASNTAQNSYDVVVAPANGSTDITFAASGDFSVRFTEYKSAAKDVELKTSSFGSVIISNLNSAK